MEAFINEKSAYSVKMAEPESSLSYAELFNVSTIIITFREFCNSDV